MGNSASTTNPTAGSNCKASAMSIWSPGVIIILLIGIFTFISSFVSTSKFLGSKDDWVHIQAQVTKIVFYTIVGTVCFTIAMLLFYTQFPEGSMYVSLIISCVALGLGYCALAIAAISR